jgi:threonine synthase
VDLRVSRTKAPNPSFLSHLECIACGGRCPYDRLIGVSPCCDAILVPRYDLEAARERLEGRDLRALFHKAHGLWRYASLLPPPGPLGPVTLGEGHTPLLDLPRSQEDHQLGRLTIKDETRNPTGTFKARGFSVAVTMARALGATSLRTPTAGNAGAALAVYAARAGLRASVAMPRDAPGANKQEVRAAGARLIEVDGLIPDCARVLAQDPEAQGAFDVSTFREPYRLEGKKTMGFELWHQHGLNWPDVVLFPTGGGMGILALKKAHDELARLGIVNGPPPRLVAVQASGCSPLAQAFDGGLDDMVPVEDPATIAGGLRVPTPKAAPYVLRAVRETGGAVIRVDDDALLDGMRAVAKETGILVSPEAGAGYAGVQVLRGEGRLDPHESVSVFLTGTGLKHLDLYAGAA